MDDLLALHKNFVKSLVAVQKNNIDRSVDKLGPTLYNQVCWEGDEGGGGGRKMGGGMGERGKKKERGR